MLLSSSSRFLLFVFRAPLGNKAQKARSIENTQREKEKEEASAVSSSSGSGQNKKTCFQSLPLFFFFPPRGNKAYLLQALPLKKAPGHSFVRRPPVPAAAAASYFPPTSKRHFDNAENSTHTEHGERRETRRMGEKTK